MLIDALRVPLGHAEGMDAFWGRLDAGDDASCGVAASARPFMVAARYSRTPQPTLAVVAGEDAAAEFARNVAAYLGDDAVLRFPERSDLPFQGKPADARQVARRMEALHALASGRDCVVVASARALLRRLPPTGTSFFQPIELAAGSELGASSREGIEGFEDLVAALVAAGYRNTDALEGPGSFGVHGGTVDIWPGNLTFPVRIDFFGDEVDEIRRIVPTTGQTIASLDAVDIYPVREFTVTRRGLARARQKLANPAKTNPALRELLDKAAGDVLPEGVDALLPYLYEKTATLGDFLGRDALSVLVEPHSLIDDAQRAWDAAAELARGSNIALEGLFCEPAALSFGANQRCTYVSIMRVGAAVDLQLPVKRTDVAGDPERLFGKMRNWIDAGYACVFCVPDFRARKDMELAFVDHGLPIVELADADSKGEGGQGADEAAAASSMRLRHGAVNVSDVDVPLGIVVPKARLAIVSIADMRAHAQRPSKRIDITEVTFPYKPGDYVVHATHGIAFFRDLVRQEIGGAMRDYLLLEYAEGDKLYVPVEQFDRVTRYVGPDGASPRLTRLNTSDWSRALGRARRASRKMAFDLVDVYTRRAAAKGHRYSPDTPWQRQMEEAFPYQETADQAQAIADVKADMESSRPMDRLICGDVGFGKTEVAMRAAFKATQDGKQVMVLCPTTILAQQHFSTFSERFAPFGVSVEVLSRFRTPAQQRRALEGFAEGTVDVLVGTHRLLSRDVNPHDLGLVIIDEEQRFGVEHKEQMKNLREYIDVLALSATPIPRTMQMSLSGVRDMSLILTPPDERRPVEVHVGEWDPDVVSAAIRRELERGGQVYYVSNRVRDIDEAVGRVAAAAPEARVGFAHGQMGREQLERVMEDFAAGELDVLVATTIIESGIDNPHTNTLIIEDAQRLGLAQMYQLKGRVGRSGSQAYAYLMFPAGMQLTEEAAARLTAIDEHQDLGSGMRIAMRDLEIRGAGSMLGAEQSGNLSAVGFDLFAQMLAEAVNATREGRAEAGDLLPPVLSDITVNLPQHAYIGEDYIPDADVRVKTYRRIAAAATIDEVDEIADELARAYPSMPAAAQNYLMKARVRARANEMGATNVTVVAGKLNVWPISQPTGELWAGMRRARARYVAKTGKLQLPLAYLNLSQDDSLLEAVFNLLLKL